MGDHHQSCQRILLPKEQFLLVPTLAIGSKVFSLPASGILLTNSFETSRLQSPRLSIGSVAIVKTGLGAAGLVLDREPGSLSIFAAISRPLGVTTWA